MVRDKNSGMIRKISDWFGINFNPKISPGMTQFCRKKEIMEAIIPKIENFRSREILEKKKIMKIEKMLISEIKIF